MNLSHITIQNYRALRHVSLPLSRFGCFIGKNNAGKSTVLQAISLFFSGTKLSAKDFYDPSAPIRIEIKCEEITDTDLDRLAPEHREKIAPLVIAGRLTLVRFYDTSGGSKLMYVTLAPRDDRFRSDRVAALVKGKSKGALIVDVVNVFPELDGKFTASTVTQTKVREEIQNLADSLPETEKHLADSDLPTGIDASIKALLPEPIYIPAVKNLADDVKAKESTPFGKVLGILLAAVEPQLGDVKKFFEELSGKFNRQVQDDGARVDNRLAEVQLIEKTVESYLRESFANVSLEINIPPPELKTILSSAELLIDDGVQGAIESKGDGLRRAAVFAILRSYVALNEPGAIAGDVSTETADRHILLFEEPELYLHPSAQKVLFDALSVFSRKNHVMITTHSPAFFGPEGTASFIKLSKANGPGVQCVPFTVAQPVDLREMTARDQFQLICFENNNAAFFFDSVILVEGDSDYIVLPHVAQLVTPSWKSIGSLHKFVRINGKGSIKRYREFFTKFGVRVAVVTDLDLLTSGFDMIVPCDELKRAHSTLLQAVDNFVAAGRGFDDPSQRQVKDAQAKTELVGLWKHAKQAWREVQEGKGSFEMFEAAVEKFFSWEKQNLRLKVLQECQDSQLVKLKRDLLSNLRVHDIYVLERGALEAYYPEHITGHDKPSKAQDFCTKIVTREALLELCDDQCAQEGAPARKEFEIICEGLFKDMQIC